MEIDSFTELARKRISIAKEYLDKLKEKMGDCFLYAYVYGSTAKNIPHEESDIDIILIVKKPTQEERTLMNSSQGGLFEGDRCGSINFTHNSHYLFLFCRQFQEKYHIDISPYYHYEEEGLDRKIREMPISLRKILEEPTLKYPEDFINVAYL